MMLDHEIPMIWTPKLVFNNTGNEEMTNADNYSNILIDRISILSNN